MIYKKIEKYLESNKQDTNQLKEELSYILSETTLDYVLRDDEPYKIYISLDTTERINKIIYVFSIIDKIKEEVFDGVEPEFDMMESNGKQNLFFYF